MPVLVMTDLEGSTRLWAEHTAAMDAVMTRHHQIVHGAISAHGGWRPVDQGEGDAVFAAFESVSSAIAAVIEFQRLLSAEPWPDGIAVRDRVGVHMGEVILRGGNLFGPPVNRAARIRSLGAGGQVLVSAPIFDLVRDRLPDGVRLEDLGEHRLKDLARPERIFQLAGPGLPDGFPSLAGLDRARHNLPLQSSSLIGRQAEVTELLAVVSTSRLVTIVGFGGMGKTRLALQVAAELADGDGDGVWFVDLSSLTDAAQVPAEIIRTLEIDAGDDPMGALQTWLAPRKVLFVLDNLEQLLPEVAAIVQRIVAAGTGVHLLATCREPLRLGGEHIFQLAPLPVPPAQLLGADVDWTAGRLEALSTYSAVEMLLARVTDVRRDFVLDATSAAAVAAICARVDGLPLAIELVAARLRVMSPQALLPRLDRALTVLTAGNRDLPTRHRTLRATIIWSTDTLEPDQALLLDRLSAFPARFSLTAAEEICGPSGGSHEDLDVFSGLLELVDHSLVRLHPGEDGQDDRYELLVPIREYADEQLARDADRDRVRDRHADHYARAVIAKPDTTREQWHAIVDLVRESWPDLQVALSRLHERGDVEAEIATSPWVFTALRRLGRDSAGLAILRHAIAHVDGIEPSVRTAVLLAAAAGHLYATYRDQEGYPLLARAIDLAEQLDDAAVVVYLAGVNSFRGDPLRRNPGLIDHAGDLFERATTGEASLPPWFFTVARGHRRWASPSRTARRCSGGHRCGVRDVCELAARAVRA